MITLTFDTRAGSTSHARCRIYTATVDLVEFSPELVYQAANRIQSLEEDLAALPEEYRPIREALDRSQCYSMTAGDSFSVHSASGTPIGIWHCEPIGWRVERPQP